MHTSIAARANLNLIEENYRRWQDNPQSVDPGWSAFFEGFELGDLPQLDGAQVAREEARETALQSRVDALLFAYRTLGHTIARVDPLAEHRPQNRLLTLHALGFNEHDLDLCVSSQSFLDNRKMALREMIATSHDGNDSFREAANTFLQHARETINPTLTAADVREMLIQHILTEEVSWLRHDGF